MAKVRKNYRLHEQTSLELQSVLTIANEGKPKSEQITETDLIEKAWSYYYDSLQRAARKSQKTE